MSEQKKTNDKILSLAPLSFEDALKGLLATEPPPKEKQEKKTPAKRRSRSTSKKTDGQEQA